MADRVFTESDLRIAEELGGMKTCLVKIDENLNRHIITEERDKAAMWNKIDQHSKLLDEQSGAMKAIVYVGGLIQLVVVAFVAWWKTKMAT